MELALLVTNCKAGVPQRTAHGYHRNYGSQTTCITTNFTWNQQIHYVYWIMHHLDSWIKIDQLDVICFIISLFTAQHVSNASTSIFRSLRLIGDLFHVLYCSGPMCVGVMVWFGWGGVVSLCRLKHYSCWTVNSEIIKQVTSSRFIFIQPTNSVHVFRLSFELGLI